MPYKYTVGFYLKQYVFLLISGTALYLLFRRIPLDTWLMQFWFDTATGTFPYRHNEWLVTVNYEGLQSVAITLSAALLAAGLIMKRWHWVAIALITVCGPLIVVILQQFSSHSCPIDLTQYGGDAQEFLLFDTTPSYPGEGECFPAEHAAQGFSLMGLFFLFTPVSKSLATTLLFCAMAFGFFMGWGQMMRGEAYLSYNLWALWWVWLTEIVIYQIYSETYYHLHHDKTYSAEGEL